MGQGFTIDMVMKMTKANLKKDVGLYKEEAEAGNKYLHIPSTREMEEDYESPLPFIKLQSSENLRSNVDQTLIEKYEAEIASLKEENL